MTSLTLAKANGTGSSVEYELTGGYDASASNKPHEAVKLAFSDLTASIDLPTGEKKTVLVQHLYRQHQYRQR